MTGWMSSAAMAASSVLIVQNKASSRMTWCIMRWNLCSKRVVFLGRVKAGEAADFRMAAEAESDAVERLVEVFQGDGWSGGQSSPQEIIALYGVTCDARQCPILPIDADTIEAIRALIADLTVRWNAVAVGDTLTLAL